MSSSVIPGFPVHRARRLRHHPSLRSMISESRVHPDQLVLPLFVREGTNVRREISSMPGIFQLSPDLLVREAARAQNAGVRAVLLFGIPDKKDTRASGAYSHQGIVQKAVRRLKKEMPGLVIMTDVCLCEYMSHGHCGVVVKKAGKAVVSNDPTLDLLARTSVSHAECGADLVAPSDMMDGRVGAIRSALDKAGFEDTPILSYAAKFSSSFYGPFREAAESAPQFGDRRSYQMDPGNANEALKEVALDIQEGADMVMVKPGLAYLDLVYRIKQTFGFPTAVYSVSAEYSMIKAAAAKGWIDEKAAFLECFTAMRRAGADLIITYAAVETAGWLKEQQGGGSS